MVVPPDALTPTQDETTFDEWCVVELLGHRRLAAHVSETTIAGHGYLRLDEPATNGTPGRTQYVSPKSVYALHPTTQQVVQAMAAQWRTEPVQRWELPAAQLPQAPGWPDDDEDDGPPL